MMSPALQERLQHLARTDAHVHATLAACQRHGLNEVDTLMRVIMALATLKDAMQAQILHAAQHAPPAHLALLTQDEASDMRHAVAILDEHGYEDYAGTLRSLLRKQGGA